MMKSFSPLEIKNRVSANLKKSGYWANVIADSTVDSLITGMSEPSAELARYYEYILRESRWEQARNLTSLTSQASFLGYKPRRKTSAIGYLMISHDPTFNNAGLPSSGMIDFDDIVAQLTPYTGTPFSIIKGVRFAVGRSSVIVTETVDYEVGLKYILVPVVEGELVTPTRTILGNSFETLIIQDENVEANTTSLSGNFFKVSSVNIVLEEFDSIFLAPQDTYAYEVSTNKTLTETRITLGNGIAGKKLPPQSVVTVQYLKTKGKDGNFTTLFATWKAVDAISLPSNVSIYVKNIEGIQGGKDKDTLETIRSNAPKQYLLDGSIVSYDAYQAVIESIPSILKAKVFYGVYVDPTTSASKDTIYYTAIAENGATTSASFIEPKVSSLVKGRNSPLDFYKYIAPKFLHLRLNVRGRTKVTNPAGVRTSIYNNLYDTYNTVNQGFSEVFDMSKVTTAISTIESLDNIAVGLEVICDIKGSEFMPWSLNSNYYTSAFSFDPSYFKIQSKEDGALHVLRIDVIMTCTSCADSQRTLIVIQDPIDPVKSIVKQYKYLGELDLTDKAKVLKLLNNQNTLFPELTDASHAQKAQRKIDIKVDLDLTTLTSIGGEAIGQGSIYIPSRTLGELYFNFESSDLEKDTELLVQAIAQPVSSYIVPLYNENIVRIDGETNLRDIRVEGIISAS